MTLLNMNSSFITRDPGSSSSDVWIHWLGGCAMALQVRARRSRRTVGLPRLRPSSCGQSVPNPAASQHSAWLTGTRQRTWSGDTNWPVARISSESALLFVKKFRGWKFPHCRINFLRISKPSITKIQSHCGRGLWLAAALHFTQHAVAGRDCQPGHSDAVISLSASIMIARFTGKLQWISELRTDRHRRMRTLELPLSGSESPSLRPPGPVRPLVG